MPDAERLPPGQLIADRYRVDAVVGRGAMGVVYAGEHVRVGRRVAIKVLTRAWSNDATVRQRFEAEARAASAAGHPNVIQVFDVGELPDQRLYLVMEFIDGSDLYTLLKAAPSVSLVRACRLIRDAAFGVRAAHAQGVIHRDLKLENVMVQTLPEGEAVKVLDFGIAAGVIEKRATLVGMTLGTPEYMAPEQVDGAPPTVRFDIYALGVMLFELLTRRLPIADENPLKLMALKGHVPAARVIELRPEVPAALDQLVADCLEIDPSRRPASCDAFIERLTQVLAALESEPAPAPTTTTLIGRPSGPPRPSRATRPYVELRSAGSEPAVLPVPATRPGRSRGVLLWVGAGLAVLGVVGVVLVLYGRPSHDATIADATPIEPQPVEPPAQTDPAAHDRAKPEPEPEPEPVPVSVQSPVQSPPEEPEPSPPTNVQAPHDTPRCEQQRTRALDGRRTHDWQRVLSATQQRECWASARERKKLETQAYMELGRFEDCLRTGKHLNDTEATKWVTLCSKRLAG
ncbi:serine/threonine-protein kinase [Enhygromyxa salina]|uniref:Serine/threonine-protein kinase Pkn1 n=1 Tax=Enhygromyxa salina TaxID=215803 RepID=A0A2S9YMU7_9BACT|nr:serine/threonine-protein kinase [Enhygromyxa salina]PRQ06409.1 Serine/threonine-protein kinase Pkn1 [Enhygromyxa salina]